MTGRHPAPTRLRGTGHRRARRVAIVAGSLLLVAAAVLATLRSPLFAADRLVVEGERALAADRVLEVAGISAGDNVVWLDEAAAERRLEADPWIASATVSADLPDAVRVRVVERVAVGAIETHDGWQVIAADGVVVARVGEASDLPTITTLVPGDDAAAIAAGLLGAMAPTLRRDVLKLTLDADGLVRLALRDGVHVDYGDASEGAAKAESLEAVLDWADEERARVELVDVSVPRAPAARLIDGSVAAPARELSGQ